MAFKPRGAVISHRADESFFQSKREWSKRKDTILANYLTAYLPKIATQRRPVLIVDAFAGPGLFEDGSDGSPLIISKVVQNSQSGTRRLQVPVRLWAIEADSVLHERLKKNIGPFAFAEARKGAFLYHVDDIIREAAKNNVFLYLDPFTVEGLEWSPLDRVFSLVTRNTSIEVLLNFNSVSFVRRGRAALSLSACPIRAEQEDSEPIDSEPITAPAIEALNAVVGGEWWQSILREHSSFPDMVRLVAARIRTNLSHRFAEVGIHSVKAMPHHTVPKYFLMFGSRHAEALLLMNDQMVQSLQVLARLATPAQGTLFELRPTEIVPDESTLSQNILNEANTPLRRRELIIRVVRKRFCEFTYSRIRGEIETLLKAQLMQSETGRVRINDDVKVWATSRHDV